MRNPLRFFIDLIQQPTWVLAWVLILIIANIASTHFWNEFLAQLIFIAFMISSMLVMALYTQFGYAKILGLGHILWFPLLVYVLVKIPATSNTFKYYLIVWSLLTLTSLVIDVVDVWKYFTRRQNT